MRSSLKPSNPMRDALAIELQAEQYNAIEEIIYRLFDITCFPGDVGKNVSMFLEYRVWPGSSPKEASKEHQRRFPQFAGVNGGKCKRNKNLDDDYDCYVVPLSIFSLVDFVLALSDYVEKNPMSKCNIEKIQKIEEAFKKLFSIMPQIQRAPIKIPTKPGLWPDEQKAACTLLKAARGYDQIEALFDNTYKCYFTYRRDSVPALFRYMQQDLRSGEESKGCLLTSSTNFKLEEICGDSIAWESETVTINDRERFTLRMHSFFAASAVSPDIDNALATYTRNTEFTQLIAVLITTMSAPVPLARLITEYLFGSKQDAPPERTLVLR